ncbi:mechanosensitive ion channel family protein [Bacillus sp. NPDC077027]|uniref:mechanosensitive ion channel family protein n=1 Tax=Bacillus sp. NPDC077027 TaxID=3390548 RepID=UPI003D0274DE
MFTQKLMDTYFTMDTVIQIGISLCILFIFLLLRKVFTKYLFNIIFKLTNKSKTEVFNQIVVAFEKPARLFFVALGLYFALRQAPYFEHHMDVIVKFYRSSIILMMTWGLCNLTAKSSFLFHKVNSKFDLDMDDILAPFLSKVLRFVIIALSISVVAQEFSYDVNGLVAGLGLGGLAFALAAQDTVANFFGGIVIITEKPFTMGDFIETPSVLGTVEDITFRSTKFRTPAEAVVTVPNSTLSKEPITNWTRMNKRQITFSVRVSYNTPKENIDRCIKRLKEMLHEHDGVHKETIMVNLDILGDSYLNLFFNFYTKTTSWAESLDIKQDINYRIMDIFHDEGVEFAFPGQTIYMKQKNEKQLSQ